jgi:hypothetical protein
MNRGLTDADMAQEAHADGESIRADSIAAVRRIVLLSLNDELVIAPTSERSNGYARNGKRAAEKSPGHGVLIGAIAEAADDPGADRSIGQRTPSSTP